MRQWNLPAKYMCDSCLIEEHDTMHLFAFYVLKGIRFHHFLNGGSVEVHNLGKRHDEIAKELEIRDISHYTEFPEVELYETEEINKGKSLFEKIIACEDCRRIVEITKGEIKWN